MDVYRAIDRSHVQFDFIQHTADRCFFQDEVESLGGRIFSVPRFSGANLLSYRSAWRSLLIAHPEWRILHGHATSTGAVYFREGMRAGIPTRIAHARSTNAGAGVQRWTAKVAKWWATDMFAVSRLAAEAEFGRPRTRRGEVTIVPNAIDTRPFWFDDAGRNEIRRRLGIGTELAFCHVGRFHSAKNHRFLLDVFAQVVQARPGTRLFLVGDGSLRAQITERIFELGLQDSVTLLGAREDVATLLAAFDGLIFPSLYEGFPGSVLEAQASGIPCVIADTITEEVCLTPLVKRLPLNSGAAHWAMTVLAECPGGPRRPWIDEVRAAGFDTTLTARWYADYYLRRSGR